MTFEQLMQEPQHLLLKCISGSRAYNLSLPSSDTDLKGIFVLPRTELYGLYYTPQVSNDSQDEVFFEIGRFIDLLTKNNPNILELLNTPPDCVLYRHPLMSLIRPEDFISNLCLDSFAGYAKTQIKKARGLNKKINRSFEQERRPVMTFVMSYKITGRCPCRPGWQFPASARKIVAWWRWPISGMLTYCTISRWVAGFGGLSRIFPPMTCCSVPSRLV